jgi:hypothetical protein
MKKYLIINTKNMVKIMVKFIRNKLIINLVKNSQYKNHMQAKMIL